MFIKGRKTVQSVFVAYVYWSNFLGGGVFTWTVSGGREKVRTPPYGY